MSSTPVAEKLLSQPSGLVFTARLLAAIVIFAAVAPGILMTAPAVAAQLASEWQLTPAEIGYLFSAELGAMSLATLPAWWWMSRLTGAAWPCAPARCFSSPILSRRRSVSTKRC
jgi:hypothetical protein